MPRGGGRSKSKDRSAVKSVNKSDGRRSDSNHENRNDNHVGMENNNRKRTCSVSGVRQPKRFKQNSKSDRQTRAQTKSSEESDFLETSQDTEVTRCEFEEGDELVQITIINDKAEFPSDENSDSDQEEGELQESEGLEDEEAVPPVDNSQRSEQATKGDNRKVKDKRLSIEDQIEGLTSTVQAMQQMMREKGILEEFEKGHKNNMARQPNSKSKKRTGESEPSQSCDDTQSETSLFIKRQWRWS